MTEFNDQRFHLVFSCDGVGDFRHWAVVVVPVPVGETIELRKHRPFVQAVKANLDLLNQKTGKVWYLTRIAPLIDPNAGESRTRH